MGYLGAKSGSGVYQAIINLMPPHDTYIEAFLGTGAVMQRKPMARRSLGIDSDQQVIDAFWNSYPVDTLCLDSIEWLRAFAPDDRTVIYCDPPYMPQTRTSNARYRHEMSEQDHACLLSVLKMQREKGSLVLLSGYRTPLYDDNLVDWWRVDFQAMTHGGVRTESIWCSFEPGKTQYHTYAGKNFTDRQRIKRKAQRWARNFEQMPPAERQAVLAALLEVESGF